MRGGMRRTHKPKFLVQFGIVGSLSGSLIYGKSDRKLYGRDDLEFMLRMANPFHADEMLYGIDQLRRGQMTLIEMSHTDGKVGIRVKRN